MPDEPPSDPASSDPPQPSSPSTPPPTSLRQVADALDALAGIDMEGWPGHMTCQEVELLAGVFRASGLTAQAQDLIGSHCDADDRDEIAAHAALRALDRQSAPGTPPPSPPAAGL